MEKQLEYKGPVLYIIHAPMEKPLPYFEDHDNKAVASNRKTITSALEKAGRQNIPVLYLAHLDPKYLNELTSSIKSKPRIVWLGGDSLNNPVELKARLEKEKIIPSRVIGMGIYRNICVVTGLETMRRAYPKSEVVMLEGSSSFFSKRSASQRAAYRERAKRNEISRTKKLGRKHFLK